MSIITIIKEIKKIHPQDIVLIQVGKFVQSYGKDSYVISHMFGYKLKDLGNNLTTVGFPENALKKVISKLEEKKINYLIVNRRNNYEVIEKSDNKNLNTYEKNFKEAYELSKLKIRAYKIYKYLNDNLKKEDIKIKIRKIEKLLTEENGQNIK